MKAKVLQIFVVSFTFGILLSAATCFAEGCARPDEMRWGGKSDCEGAFYLKAKNTCTIKVEAQLCVEVWGKEQNRNWNCGNYTIPAGGTSTHWACKSTGQVKVVTK